MIKKWAIAAMIYLIIVMAGYSIYAAVAGPDPAPAQQQEMNH
ncbi:hypothetical protein ACF5W4_14870 [Bacillota bacterium Lsc_1132]